MIDKIKFFEKKKRCPTCNKKLSLYLCIDNVSTFKNQVIKGQNEDFLYFKPLKDDKFNLHINVSLEDFIEVKIIDDIKFSLSFSSEKLFRIIEASNLRFFYLCNEDAIKISEGYINVINNYEISSYDVCYYKLANSLLFKYNYSDDVYSLSLDSQFNNTVGLEIYSIFKVDKDITKYYCLVYDFNDDKTKFYFVTNDTNSIVEFTENQFVKELPTLCYYPDFKDKEKIINKLDSWILLS
jgi:hypothetical protein